MYLGAVALKGQDFATAEQQYWIVMPLQPRNALAMNKLPYIVMKQGKPSLALSR